jgi:hypothetical protein
MAARLRYHAPVFTLLGREPNVDPEAVARIDEAERAAGSALPAAVREWFQLADAVDLLRQDRSEGEAITLDELLQTFGQLATYEGPPEFKRVRVLISSHSFKQKYVEWAVQLAGDDPPVVRGEELHFSDEMRWETPAFAGRFTDFVFYWLWTYRTAGLARDAEAAWLRASADVLVPPDLDFLVATFHEGPRLTWSDGAVEYCFFNAEGRVGLVAESNSPEVPADWRLFADTPAGLEALARRVWGCGTLRQTLEAATPAGQEVLARLRGEGAT